MKIIIWLEILFFVFLQFICLTVEKAKKKVRVFHCVTYDGKPFSWSWFRDWVHIQKKPILLESKEGLLIIMHGNSNGTMRVYKDSITIDQLADIMPAGQYNLISCYNGCRQDIKKGSVTIIRVDTTCRRYISVCLYMRGNIYVTSSWELHKLHEKIKALKKLL